MLLWVKFRLNPLLAGVAFSILFWVNVCSHDPILSDPIVLDPIIGSDRMNTLKTSLQQLDPMVIGLALFPSDKIKEAD